MTTESATHWLEEWFDLAQELASIGFWRMDPATGSVEWSPTMFRLFEFPLGPAPRAEETMSRVHPDDRAAAYIDLSSNLNAGGYVSISRLMLPSGHVRIVESRTTVQRNDHGEIIMIVGSVLDITERAARERGLVEERDAAEEHAARDMTYAANLSHEIRTPIMAIIGYVHLLEKREDLSPDMRRDVELVARSSEMLLSVANNVLGQFRATATLSKLEHSPVATSRAVQNVLEIFANQASSKGVKLHYAHGESVPEYLTAHGGALTQILVNLIGNSVKFTDTGSITVSSDYNEAVSALSVTVADTGHGFDEATRDAMFRRFSQGGGAEHTLSGAGLGLSICKGLVEALGGTIDASSTLRVGTRITFTLPARPSPPPVVAEAARSRAAKLLVIDDHPAVREVSSRILTASGADVETASTGASGLQLARTQAFDLILIDLNLPDKSGLDIVEAIRGTNGPNAETRILAFTAADIDLNSLPATFDGYVGKPVDPLKLAELVLDPARTNNFRQDYWVNS